MSDKSLIKKQWLERYPRKFPKADTTVPFNKGTVVVSRTGRDRYRTFIVVDCDLHIDNPETLQGSRVCVWVTDGGRRGVEKPKLKNLSHVIPVGFSEEAAAMIEAGTLTNEAVREIVSKYRCSELTQDS